MVKNNKIIWIIGIAVVAIVLFMNKGAITSIFQADHKTETPVGIEFRVRSGGQTQAIVNSELTPDAEGQFGVSVTNNKPIEITNVQLASKSDQWTGAGNPFDSAGFSFSPVTLGAGQTSSRVDTNWFDLEWYATNHPGKTQFTFNFQYDYRDAEGNLQSGIPVSSYAEVEILGESCSDTTPFNQCNAGGSKCIYQTGGLQLVADQDCCLQAGGVWGGASCSLGCGAIPVGSCDTTPTPGDVRTNTLCGPSATMIEDCNQCHCFDYYGNQEASCDGTSCVFSTYSEAVNINIIGSGSGTTCDTCGSWTDDSCGTAGCAASQMHETRACSPTDCIPADGLGTSRCVSDVSCTTCDCTAWSDGFCGVGGCTASERQQTRACSPSGCAAEVQCAADALCVATPTQQVAYTPSANSGVSIYSLTYAGQTFMPTSTFTLTSVKLSLYKSGSPSGNFFVDVTETDGTILSSSSAIVASTLPTSSTVYDVSLPETTLNQGATYVIVARLPNGDTLNRVIVRQRSTDADYPNGNRGMSFDGGESWTWNPTADLYFEGWGY